MRTTSLRWIIFPLIGLLVLQPSLPALAKAKTKASVGVIPLMSLTEEDAALLQTLKEQMRASGYQLIPHDLTSQALNEILSGSARPSLKTISKQALEEYYQGHFRTPNQIYLERLLNAAKNNQGVCASDEPSHVHDWAEAYTTMTLIHLALGQTRKASEAFAMAYRLNPHLPITDTLYPESVIRFFNKIIEAAPQTAKAERSAPLSILSTPVGAKAYLDGRFIGQTPLKLKKAVEGDQHAFTFIKEGLPAKCLLASIDEKQAVEADFTQPSPNLIVNPAAQKIRTLAKFTEDRGALNQLAELTGADQLIFLNRLSSAKSTKTPLLTYQVYRNHSLFLGASHLAQRSASPEEQAFQIVAQLTPAPSSETLDTQSARSSAPRKSAKKEAPANAPASSQSKSKTVLWVVGGLLVAGAAASVGILMGGGGGGISTSPEETSSVSVDSPAPQ